MELYKLRNFLLCEHMHWMKIKCRVEMEINFLTIRKLGLVSLFRSV